MTSKIKKYIVVFLILLNIYMLFLTRPSIEKECIDLNMENENILNEIKKFTSGRNITDKDIYYKTDREFYGDVESILALGNMKDYELIFLDHLETDGIVESDILISFKSDFLALDNIIKGIESKSILKLKSLEIYSQENGELKSDLIVSIKSDFNNLFRTEGNLVNKQPFRLAESLHEEVIEIENVEFVGEVKEDTEDLDLQGEEFNIGEKLKNSEIGPSISNYNIGDLYFMDSEYENLEKLKDDFYIYSFNMRGKKNSKRYIGDKKVLLDSGHNSNLVEFWINTNIKDIDIGLEVELMKDGENYKKDYIFTYKDLGWKYFSKEIDNDLVSARLFLVDTKEFKGSILIDKFNIRGLKNDRDE